MLQGIRCLRFPEKWRGGYAVPGYDLDHPYCLQVISGLRKVRRTASVYCLQCAREQMGIRANGNLAPKFIASYSRANGNSSKWECSQKNHAEWLKMGTFLVKWDSFEHSNAPKHQNGKPISLQVIREQMGIRANGNIPGISCNWSLNGIPFARERTVDDKLSI